MRIGRRRSTRQMVFSVASMVDSNSTAETASATMPMALKFSTLPRKLLR